jgi:cytochrome c oxidase cbb3-type subunit III
VSNLQKRTWPLWPLLTVLTAGCDLPGRPRPADSPVPAERVTDFGVLYGTHCAGCHGADGKLGPAPPLNDPIFLAIVPDAELFRVISEGRAVSSGQRSPMPGFGLGKSTPLTADQAKVLAETSAETDVGAEPKSQLTVEQVKLLVAGIKQRWGPPASPASSVPPYLTPAGAGRGRRDEGARVFARACAGCHGTDGQGTSGDRPVGAINNAAFLALVSDQALRRLAITGRPDVGMPAYDGTDGRPPDFQPLTSAEIDDVVALLAYWRQGGPDNHQ